MRIPPPVQLFKELINLPELDKLDKSFPGGIMGLIEKELPPEFSDIRELTFALGIDETGDRKWAIFEESKLLGELDKSNYGMSPFELIFRGRKEKLEPFHGSTQAPAVLPVFPSDCKGKIRGWISPKNLAGYLKNAILQEGELENKQLLSTCQGNSRKILKIITKESRTQKKDIVTGPLSREDLPKCPLGGHYSMMAQSSMAASSQNAPASAYKVLCDHKPPRPFTLETIPEAGPIKIMKPVLEKLRNFPDILISFDETEKRFAMEVSMPKEISGKLPVNYDETEKNGFSFDLDWVPVSELKIPITEKFPMAMFLGYNPWTLFARSGIPSAVKDMKSVFKTGVVALFSRGFDPEEFFFRGMGNVRFAVGTPDENGKILSFLADELARGGLKKETIEEQGVELQALVPEKAMKESNLEIGVVDFPPYRFFSGSRETTRALLRYTNGEDRGLKIFENIGDKVKFALAFRMDHIGKGLAKIIGLVLFEKETSLCRKSRIDFLNSYNQAKKPSPGFDQVEFTEIPESLAEKCPRQGLMLKDKRLICAVHDQRIFIGKNCPTEPDVDFPNDRWLLIAMVKRGDKAVLEAKIVMSGEVKK